MTPLLTAPRIDGLILGEGVILLDFDAAGEEAFSLLWVETADEGSLAGEEANAG